MLDAITWALWGKARARRDDELITLGETEMWVEFEFGLGGQRYRIWRQRSKKGRGQSDLHFYVWNPSTSRPSRLTAATPLAGCGAEVDGEWQLLDEGGLLERQAQITRTLRLDYDTFINSSFLLQGRADSFTVKTPSDRKQILADILGLSRYDLYEQRAKEEAQARKERAGLVEGEITAIERDLARRGDYEAQLSAARGAALTAAEALRARGDRAGGASAAGRRVAGAGQPTGRSAPPPDPRRRGDQGRWPGSLRPPRPGWPDRGGAGASAGEIEAGWAALQQARADDAAWNARLLRHTQLQEQVHRGQLAVSQARLALEAEQRRLADRHAELGRKVTAGQEQALNLAQARAALAQFDALQARRDALAAELREVSERAAALKVENDRLKAEGQAVKDKMEMMGQAAAAACPLCGQALTADHRDRMLIELEAETHTAGATNIASTVTHCTPWPSARPGWRPRMPTWRASFAAAMPGSARPRRPRPRRPKARPRPTSSFASRIRSPGWRPGWPPKSMRRPSAPSWRA